jgi:hypothetical protein
MNCQPGDIAIVIGTSEHVGMLVEVLYAPPPYSFDLPNGHRHVAGAPGKWVFKILGSQRLARTTTGQTRLTQYGVGADSCLRPLRSGEEVSTLRETEAA